MLLVNFLKKMGGVIDQLKSMIVTFDDVLTVGKLVCSIDVSQLSPVVSSVKSLTEEKISWKRVTNRVIEEVKSLKCNLDTHQMANIVSSKYCSICYRRTHDTSKYYLNPINPNNYLKLGAIHTFLEAIEIKVL